jgi:hypothetical protein
LQALPKNVNRRHHYLCTDAGCRTFSECRPSRPRPPSRVDVSNSSSHFLAQLSMPRTKACRCQFANAPCYCRTRSIFSTYQR